MIKWIGQHIWDFVSRFRNDVYLENLTTTTESNVLVVDSDGKVSKSTSVGGDITGVTAGTNCSGGGTTGNVTINVDDAFLINSGDDTTTGTITAGGFTTTGTWTFDEYTSGTVGITTVQDSGTTFNDNDTSLMTAAAIDDRINTAISTTVGSDVDLTSEVSGILPVANGGTGSSTHTSTSVLVGSGSSAIASYSNFTYTDTSGYLKIMSTATAEPVFELQNYTDDATCPEIRFRKLRNNHMTDLQDGDNIGKFSFWGYDDGTPATQQYAEILGEVLDSASNGERGRLRFKVAEFDGTVTTGLQIDGADQDGEIDVTIGAGANSTTTVSGKLVVGTRIDFDSTGITAIQNSGESFTDNDTSLMTSAAVEDKILSYGYTTNVGDITGVDLTGGTGIEIASETGTGSGNYSATINCDLEGTELKSTTNGNEASTKFLRADGDGTCSWQVPPGAVTSIVAGDGIDVSGATGDVTVTAEDASTTNPGIVELATTAETTTGTSTTLAVTPDGLQDGYTGSSNVVTTGALNSGSITSGFGNIDTGSSTIDTTGAVSTGTLTADQIKHEISGSLTAGDIGHGAEVLYGVGTTSVTAGRIYTLHGGTWEEINAGNEDDSSGLMAVASIAAGSGNSSNGMIIKGCVTLENAYVSTTNEELGAIVYASTTNGRATTVMPSSSNDFVRILGYSLNVSNKKMFFNPDTTYIQRQ